MIDTTELRVRYAETDQMGRAHHGHYLVWCELGRTNLMREHGVSYAELEKTGILLPVARVEIEYRAPLVYDQVVIVRTRVVRVRSREIVFGYEIVAAPGDELAATSKITLVSVDPRGRSTRLPADVRARLVGLCTAAGGAGQ
jgi:acyl-CoA thioester hydrolase